MAVCLSNLSVQQAALGKYGEAVSTAEGALSRHRDLHRSRVSGGRWAPAGGGAGDPATTSDAELQESIDSLHTMGNISVWLPKLGRRDEARAMSKKVSCIGRGNLSYCRCTSVVQ